eukprot:CAMPEP_0118938622 /NCGR_PEP_ID=MMETSP1169-20130426/26548_1 /TAXON_ID=36882 /ORGANISM="Pyramimonas obovata, Strain CCMP722" /LENGTH=779 /DNA_ID=CAMNT_0006882621 /DNA_START=12 /DNA_END=2351 /DNA_ORIENTATION=-
MAARALSYTTAPKLTVNARAPKSSTAQAVRVAKRAAPMKSVSFLSGASTIAHKQSTLGKQTRQSLRVSATATADEETFKYQAEVSRLMDLIVNSLYSSKEIFLRELVSNASDALDKHRFDSLTSGKSADSLEIKIKADEEGKSLTIEDNGIGMTKSDLVDTLGTIANSGTSKFMEMLKEKGQDEGSNLIGQFGVGFYSAFLVADTVTVITKNEGDDTTWVWESSQGADGYTIKPSEESLERGTKIVLKLKEEAEEFGDNAKLETLVKTYSEFVNFPIKVWKVRQDPEQVLDEEATARAKEDAKKKAEEEGKEPEEVEDVMKTIFNTVEEYAVANDNKPLWVRSPREVEEAEYAEFFKMTFKEFMDPAAHSHFVAEGDIEFRSILYLPGMAPMDQQDFNAKSKNIKLFVKRVFISDDFGEDLMPRYLQFVKGVVDSSDLPLNVSREILQEGRVVRIMRKRLVRKSLDMMKAMAKEEDKSAYNTFFENFGRNIKVGVIEDQDNRKALASLLRFSTSQSGDTLASLDEYVARMKEDQKGIYFVSATSKEAAEKSPFIEGLVKRGLEVVYLTEPIDEIALTNLQEFDGKPLVDVSKDELELGTTDEEKKEAEETEEEYKVLTEWMKEVLGEQVEKVVVSQRLGDSPCILATSKFGWSANMERIMRAQAMGDNKAMEYMKGRKVMEINPSSPIIKALRAQAGPAASDMATSQVQLMFDTAMLTSGFIIENSSEFAERIFSMMNMTADASAEAPKEAPKDEESKGDEGSTESVTPEILSDDPWKK